MEPRGWWLGLATAVWLGAGPAWACECMERRDVAAEYARSGLVVVGVPIGDLRVANGEGSIEFDVQRAFKGAVPSRITLHTGGAGSCGIRFEAGRAYLVYAWRTPRGTWYTNICNRTTELGSGSPDLAMLETLQAAAR